MAPSYQVSTIIGRRSEVVVDVWNKALSRIGQNEDIEDAGEDAPHEGVRIAQELLRDSRDMVQGAYIIPQFGHYELAAEVIDALAVPG